METQIVFAVGLAVFAVVMVWAGKQLGKWGPRKLTMQAAWSSVLGTPWPD